MQVWHGHDYKTNALGVLLRRFWRMRLVTTVHGWVKYTRRTPLYYRIDRLSLRHYDLVLCVSEDLHAQCLASGVPAGRCLILENGIDTGEFQRTLTRCEAKERFGLPRDRFIIGAAGRLSGEKGFDILVQAADRLLADGLDLEVLIVGDGDERAALDKRVKQLGRSDRIRLLGYRSDLPDLYQAMDAFAVCSYREGLPNVLLEAMAVETPVVATRVAGIPQVIRNEENGLLVEPGSISELQMALARLYQQPDLRARLSRSGRDTVEGRYSFAARMDRLRHLYDQLLGRNGDGRLGTESAV